MSGDLVPKNREFRMPHVGTGFPCLKCSVLQREACFAKKKKASRGPNPLPTAYIYIYMHAVVLLSGPSLAFWGVIIWAKFAFYETLFIKNTIKIGVSALFLKKNCARKFEVLLSGPSWSFLRCSQLGPDNNTYLAQIITPQNAFLFFCFYNFAETPIFIVFFEHQPKFGQKRGKKNDNFWQFAKHRFIKEPVVLQPPFWPKNLCFSTLFFWN